MNSKTDHVPVMVREVLSHLVTNRNGVYLDLTVGLGGHLLAVSKAVAGQARLYGIDRDAQAVSIARERLSTIPQELTLQTAAYLTLPDLVTNWSDQLFDGIFLDLGLSSMQLDSPERGFSFRHDALLDMRFNPMESIDTAADLINNLPQEELKRIIKVYGEERNASRIARFIVRERQNQMIRTTVQLKHIISQAVPVTYLNKTLARVFQALRIAVNKELEQLETALPKIQSFLAPSGRLIVLTYHSLEDRLVKRFFQQQEKGCICPADYPVCICGKKQTLRIITRKPELPTEQEIKNNSRARSVKLRAAERVA